MTTAADDAPSASRGLTAANAADTGGTLHHLSRDDNSGRTGLAESA